MASLFYRTPVSKAEAARENVKQYAKNREMFVRRLISIIQTDVATKIAEVSLEQGKNSYKFDIDKYMKNGDKTPETSSVKKLENELHIHDFRLTKEDTELILNAITLSFQDDGFTVEKKHQTLLELTW